jgi:NAD(P)-dependent dehydrogenase (short-subunit alcohol dehydrogenase family)
VAVAANWWHHSSPVVHAWNHQPVGGSTTRSSNSHKNKPKTNTSGTGTSSVFSQTTTTVNNRRAFFGTAASRVLAAGAGAATVVTTVGTTTDSSAFSSSMVANAATPLYEPPPQSLTDKTILITGGNTGLGLESAQRLAAAGASVIVTTRTPSKGEQAVSQIQSYLQQRGISNNNVRAITLDLCNLQQVQSTAEALVKSGTKIDVLLNNAGVMAIPDRQLTVDGFERTFQTNHLGHFVWTAKLIPALNNNARIINVSSQAYLFAKNGLEIDNLNGERDYGPWSSYGQSKLANILFSQELQKRATAAGKSYTVSSLHPGAVTTDLGRYLVGEEKWNRMKTEGMTFQEKLLFVPLSKLTLTVPEGANTQIFVAADPKATQPAAYYENCQVKDVLPYARDPQAAATLWRVSEEMSGVKFTL